MIKTRVLHSPSIHRIFEKTHGIEPTHRVFLTWYTLCYGPRGNQPSRTCVPNDSRFVGNPVAYVRESKGQVCILGVHSALRQQSLPLFHIRPLLIFRVVRLVGPDRVSSMRAYSCSCSSMLVLHGDQILPRLVLSAAVVRPCTIHHQLRFDGSCLSQCGCRG